MAGARLHSTLFVLVTLAGFATLIWFAVAVPLQIWRSSALMDRTKAIAEIRALQDRISQLEEERAQFSNGREMHVLWRAAQSGAATASIQSELSRLASERGVTLSSISPTRERDLTLAQAAGFRLEMEAALDQLSSFLRDVEYNSPALVVEKASLRRLNKRNSLQSQPLVFVQLEISAPIVLDGEVSQ